MTAGSQPDPIPELAGEWHLDAEPLIEPEAELAVPSPLPELAPPLLANHNSTAPAPSLPPGNIRPPDSNEVPPSPEQIIEAMLFVGGPPLTSEATCAAIRGLTSHRFLAAIDTLTRRYRQQKRPYAIVPRDEGFVLMLSPGYRGLKERLFGGPREARLTQSALDVLSVIAYRQPVGKDEVDAIRGTDSGSTLRQLVRLGLIAIRHRAEAGIREVRYGTTPRFLQVFGLASLEELPQLGDTTQA